MKAVNEHTTVSRRCSHWCTDAQQHTCITALVGEVFEVLLTRCHGCHFLSSTTHPARRIALQEAKDEEEYLKNQMHAKWVQALKEIDLLKAAMVSGHFLFEALMKVPLQANVNTSSQEHTHALVTEDVYL